MCAIQPAVQSYLNANSGVAAFRIHKNAIDVEFRDGKRYRYDGGSPGPVHVRAMMQRALRGSGLATYINQHVRDRYAVRLSDRPLGDAR